MEELTNITSQLPGRTQNDMSVYHKLINEIDELINKIPTTETSASDKGSRPSRLPQSQRVIYNSESEEEELSEEGPSMPKATGGGIQRSTMKKIRKIFIGSRGGKFYKTITGKRVYIK
jgi:hypothetical protein